MGPRPNAPNLSDGQRDDALPPPSRPHFYMDLPSPRTGEAPPALSPLDAFAMQSRMLAKKFDGDNGRRISRLPHHDVEREFGGRQAYFAGWSGGSEGSMSEKADSSEDVSAPRPHAGLSIANQDAKNRPISHYPMFGNTVRQRSDESGPSTPFYDAPETSQHERAQTSGYFGFAAPRATSPEPVDSKMVSIAPPTPNIPSLTNSVDSVQSSYPPRTATGGSGPSYRALAPPRSPAFPKSPRSIQSIRSVRQDSGDEEGSTSGSHAFSSREFSGSSNMSRPPSPLSPWLAPAPGSPSNASEYSVSMSQPPPKPMNFSRPMSSASNRLPADYRPSTDTRPSFDSRSSFETRPSTDLPFRRAAAAANGGGSYPTTPQRQTFEDDSTTSFATSTPEQVVTVPSERPELGNSASYTYSTFSLPRGRNLERHSKGLRDSWIQSQFQWDEDKPSQAVRSAGETIPGSSEDLNNTATGRPSAESAKAPQDREERLSRQRVMSTGARSRSAGPRPFSFEPSETMSRSSPSVRTHGTSSTERTVRAAAAALHERSASAELTSEAHLEIGIQAHSRGELNKSTYHLRLAAKAGLPTAMLLYALACRHGWGMRPNQADGVMWLRRAIETAGIEMTDVEATLSSASGRTPSGDPVAEAAERRKRRAQFALAIYELGISYMNGWGCPKDKPLAARCYEVAGAWGDCDALAEAGFCYTQGLGVKKDMKKAAAFYRKAAEGGMSMAGNSWIYKPKYMDDGPKSPQKDKKQQQRSDAAALLKDGDADNPGARTPTRPRARSIWNRNKK